LAEFLEPCQSISPRSSIRSPRLAQADSFAWLYELQPEVSPKAIRLSRPLPKIRRDGTADPNILLFLRGYPSPEWVAELGSRYKIDPEFFHRHLKFLSSDQDKPTRTRFVLPSSQKTIFQMSLTSMGTQECIDVRSKRADAVAQMETYLHDLKKGDKWKCGNSVVRSFEVHDEQTFSIQQTVTVYVASIDKPWIGK